MAAEVLTVRVKKMRYLVAMILQNYLGKPIKNAKR